MLEEMKGGVAMENAFVEQEEFQPVEQTTFVST
jgi:hypothetical protein